STAFMLLWLFIPFSRFRRSIFQKICDLLRGCCRWCLSCNNYVNLGNLHVQVGNCYAEFEASDRVIDARGFGDGSMKIRNAIQSRQRINLEDDPPQRDGFEPEWRGARELDV